MVHQPSRQKQSKQKHIFSICLVLQTSIPTLNCKIILKKTHFLKRLCKLGWGVLSCYMVHASARYVPYLGLLNTADLWAGWVDVLYNEETEALSGAVNHRCSPCWESADAEVRARMPLRPSSRSHFLGDYRVRPLFSNWSGPLSKVQLLGFWGDNVVRKVLVM